MPEINKITIIKCIKNLNLNNGNIQESKQNTTLFSSNTEGVFPLNNIGVYKIIDNLIKNLTQIKSFNKFLNTTQVPYYKLKFLRNSIITEIKNIKGIYNNSFNNSEVNLLNTKEKRITLLINDIIEQGDLDDNVDNHRYLLINTNKYIIKYILIDDPTNNSTLFPNNPYKIIRNGDYIEIKFKEDPLSLSNTINNLKAAIENTTDVNGNNIFKNIVLVENILSFSLQNNNSLMIFTNQKLDNLYITSEKNLNIIINNYTNENKNNLKANLIAKEARLNNTLKINNTIQDNNNFFLRSLILNINNNNEIENQYSESGLFSFFGTMLNEFTKLNFNHLGKEKILPGLYDINNFNLNITQHNLVSINKIEPETNLNLNVNNLNKTIKCLENNGRFNNINFNNNKKLSDKYKYNDNLLFNDYTVTNGEGSEYSTFLPYKIEDNNRLNVIQIIDAIIENIYILKNKIKKREDYYKKLLANSDKSLSTITINKEYIANIEARDTNCRQQGNLQEQGEIKPSFLRIYNTTNYDGEIIDYKYSQDALFELLGRWCNEIIKMNNGHLGFENIIPGLYDLTQEDTGTLINHHMISVRIIS